MLDWTLSFLLTLLLPTMIYSFEVQGHRGARGHFPENSLPAFSAACEHNVAVVEMDLLLTKDGEVVIFHDFFVGPCRCVNGDGSTITHPTLVKDLTLFVLKSFDCGRVKNPSFPQQALIPNTTIPTLFELFSLLNSCTHKNAKSMRLNLEIKADPSTPEYIPSYPLIAEKVVSQVQLAGYSDRVYYSSFDFSLLEEVRRLDPTATISLLFEEETLLHAGIDPSQWFDYIEHWARKLQASIISPDHTLLQIQDVRAAHRMGLQVIPWTVNDLNRCQELMDMEVDGIITDYPIDILARLLQAAEHKQGLEK